MNNKTIGIVALLLVVAVVAIYAINFSNQNSESVGQNQNNGNEQEQSGLTSTLTQSEWRWERTVYIDGTEIDVNNPDRFILSFDVDEKRFVSSTDCNSMSGTYRVGENNSLSFEDTISTLIFCEDTQEAEYMEMISEVESYRIDTAGNLYLEIDGGVMEFSLAN